MYAGIFQIVFAFMNNNLLPHLQEFWKQFKQLFGKVRRKREALKDVLFVSRSLWFFLLLNLLGILFFWVLPQGIDILYAMLEDFYDWRPAPFLFLCLSVLIWSMFAEFSARYRLLVIDNSGNYLTNERVAWRKFIQKSFVKLFVLFPFLIIIIGVVIASRRWEKDLSAAINAAIWPIFILFGCFILVHHLYFGDLRRWFAKLFRQPANYTRTDEYRMKNLLMGIYNEYVFRYHNDYIQGGDQSLQHGKFAIQPEWKELPLDELPESIRNFPKSNDVPAFLRPHQDAVLTRVTFPRPATADADPDTYIRWEYQMNFRLYPQLNRELSYVIFGGIGLLLLVSLLPISAYGYIGSAALVALAFAGWIAVITGLLFLDSARPFGHYWKWLNRIPWRFGAFCWILICSFINPDHPVRVITNEKPDRHQQRPTLSEHFRKWADLRHHSLATRDSIPQRIPMVLVCAEGGALRTGAMSAIVLEKLQREYPQLKDNIFAFSSVSGGSLGVGFFNAVQYDGKTNDSLATHFFSHDYLAPVIARMFYGDLFHLFLPIHTNWFDRAVALEQAWESGYAHTVEATNTTNVFAHDFEQTIDTTGYRPAWFINTTEVEGGHQSWITNVVPRGFALSQQRDVLPMMQYPVRYSTAVNFSTRFPLISPGAAVKDVYGAKRHFVDGGYVENTGAQTLLELLVALREDSATFNKVIPYVIYIRFGEEQTNAVNNSVSFGNEWNEIITGLLSTRSGRSALAVCHLKNICQNIRNTIMGKPKEYACFKSDDLEIRLNLKESKVPMNWLLSGKSLNEVNKFCDSVARSASARQFMQGLSRYPSLQTAGK